MSRARTLALVVLLLSYGAVGARQPAVRTAAPLNTTAARLAADFDIPTADRSRLLLEVVRKAFASPAGQDAAETILRGRLHAAFNGPLQGRPELSPLPLDPSVWRDTILERQVPDSQLVPAILSARNTALLYYGLSAMDDETLAALGPDRETLNLLRDHAGAFAAFGRAVRVHAGRIVLPGGSDAEPLWQELVGVEPSRPGAFVRRLFADPSGRLAYFVDGLARLDLPHQLFATGRRLPAASRLERLRALLEVFDQAAPGWRADDRPFERPAFDPAATLSLVAVTPAGALVSPLRRGAWARTFRGDEAADGEFVAALPADPEGEEDDAPVDAAWLLSRVHRSPPAVGHRRLQTILFAQRTLAGAGGEEAEAVTALRGFIAFPALYLTLERIGTTEPSLLARAASRAQSLNDLLDGDERRAALGQFQAALGILDRVARARGMATGPLAAAVASLIALDTGADGSGAAIGTWLRAELLPRLATPPVDRPDPIEAGLLAALSGPARPSGAIAWIAGDHQAEAARDAATRRLRRIPRSAGWAVGRRRGGARRTARGSATRSSVRAGGGRRAAGAGRHAHLVALRCTARRPIGISLERRQTPPSPRPRRERLRSGGVALIAPFYPSVLRPGLI